MAHTGGFNRTEIDSHSSQLFNKRIDEAFMIINQAQNSAMTAFPPTVQHAVNFHSAIFTVWMEVNRVLSSDMSVKLITEINDALQNGEKATRFLKYAHGKGVKMYHVEWSIQNSKRLNFLIHWGLQNLKYFMRMGQAEPKGLDQILDMFKPKDTPNPQVINEMEKVELDTQEDTQEDTQGEDEDEIS